MKTLTIQVSEELAKAVKIEALKRDMTLREYIANLLEKSLEKEKEKGDT